MMLSFFVGSVLYFICTMDSEIPNEFEELFIVSFFAHSFFIYFIVNAFLFIKEQTLFLKYAENIAKAQKNWFNSK